MAYPGGAILAKLADDCPTEAEAFPPFPRPMTDRPGLDFSFSGLKTHALTAWSGSAKNDAAKAAIAKAFQQAIVETLLIKCKRALKQTACRRLVVAGGVGANRSLRVALQALMQELGGEVYFPAPNIVLIMGDGCLRGLPTFVTRRKRFKCCGGGQSALAFN
ncbi:t(6)A37 threonylcarbamoyladenosine biosynthesis protein [Legionella maceachernii]|nr:t(6)A37 threonylcarbamoyladenosine biosynthesis protein [Legionella maceachernii]